MLKKIFPAVFLSSVLLTGASACFVSSHHHHGKRGQAVGNCPPGKVRDNGRCRPRGQAKKDTVIHRDHRR